MKLQTFTIVQHSSQHITERAYHDLRPNVDVEHKSHRNATGKSDEEVPKRAQLRSTVGKEEALRFFQLSHLSCQSAAVICNRKESTGAVN